MNYDEIWRPLAQRYGSGEARAIARYVLDTLFGLSLTDIAGGAVERLSEHDQQQLATVMKRLEEGEPVQYALGTAFFGMRQFHVRKGVLIPRPETYELCQWIIESVSNGKADGNEEPLHILDIGTGSGCIACTLAAELPHAAVTACDISEDALSVARENAELNHVGITFQHTNILSEADRSRLATPGSLSVIVSNPPYICNKEAKDMEPHVLDNEPHVALFVPDDDPLLFYREITRFASKALKPGGMLFFELNALYAEDTLKMVCSMGFTNVTLRNDQFGKPRMLCGKKEH